MRDLTLIDAFGVRDGDVVTLVGAGGKTTLMFALAQEFSRLGKRVVITTTVKMYKKDVGQANRTIFCENVESLERQMMQPQSSGDVVSVVSESASAEKFRGIDPSVIDELADRNLVDLVVVKGDGASEKLFKAPAEYEPTIPSVTSLVIPVVGMKAAGKSLTSKNCQRPRIAAKLAGVRVGDVITPQVIARVLTHEKGGAKNAPSKARIIPLLNQVDTEEDLKVAMETANLTLELSNGRFQRIILGRVGRDDPLVRIIER
jgi:probable selenium-dependent hydroxylase accessory protein YqeC